MAAPDGIMCRRMTRLKLVEVAGAAKPDIKGKSQMADADIFSTLDWSEPPKDMSQAPPGDVADQEG